MEVCFLETGFYIIELISMLVKWKQEPRVALHVFVFVMERVNKLTCMELLALFLATKQNYISLS